MLHQPPRPVQRVAVFGVGVDAQRVVHGGDQVVGMHRPVLRVGAVPVGAPAACEEFADITDETVCARAPEPFSAVGQWYYDFSQTTDEEVRQLLEDHAKHVRIGERS